MEFTPVNLNDLTTAKIDPLQPAEDAKKPKPNTLGQDDFLKMLVTQLEHQDPLNPQDSTEFTAQLAQFSSLEQLISMRENLDAVVQSQRELAASIGSLASSAMIGREAVVGGNRMEIGSNGLTSVAPAFDLTSSTTDTRLTVRAASGHPLGEIDLGPLPRGFHRVPDATIESLGLAPGQYEFVLEALSGGQPVAAELQSVGAITSAVPSGDEPTVRIGTITVPYSEVKSIQERSVRNLAAEAAAATAQPAAPAPSTSAGSGTAAPAASAAAPAPLAASPVRSAPSVAAASAAPAAAPSAPPTASAAPSISRIAAARPNTSTGRPVHSSALTGRAASNPTPARAPTVA